jgi:hypothetical protein
MQLRPTHPASCHCGLIRFEVDLPEGLVEPRHCNCSMCRRRGAIVATARLDQLRVVTGAEHLALYQFNTGAAKHHFCPRCGIYTHHQRRSNPDLYSFNVGCLENVDPFEIEAIEVFDGRLHPNDDARGGRLLATLRREPAP